MERMEDMRCQGIPEDRESVMQFWRTEITPEKCTVYIDHIYKVVSVSVNEGKCDR